MTNVVVFVVVQSSYLALLGLLARDAEIARTTFVVASSRRLRFSRSTSR